jgi:PKD repeat protein
MSNRARISIALGLCLLCAAACGRGRAPADLEAPPLLESFLQQELVRLHKDPRSASVAPTGADNAVFDLAATPVIVDTTTVGVTLRWTERLVGDYDQNGEVNVSDLTSLSRFCEQEIRYKTANTAGRFWPDGDPDDDGGVDADSPPAPASGAANWRRARVDGDANGVIYIYDITPLAAHWKENSAGYRVYWKAPGQSTFSLLSNPEDIQSPVTVLRSKYNKPGDSKPDADRPVRFDFTIGKEDDPLTVGQYEFYVAAYDPKTNAEGPPSAPLRIDLESGATNQLPVLHPSANPPEGVDPQVVSFSAIGSYDPDGSITGYRWDFDGDGTWDTSFAQSANAQYTYLSPKTYTAKLSARDTMGDESVAELAIEIKDSRWTRTWPDAYTATSLTHDSAGNVYAAGYGKASVEGDDKFGAVITKLSPAGVVEWCRMLELQATSAQITVLPNGHVFLGTTNGYRLEHSTFQFSDAVYAMFDQDGQLLWQKTWIADDINWVVEAKAGSDGSIYCLANGSHIEGFHAEGYAQLQRLTPSGELVWSRYLTPVETVETKSNTLVDLDLSADGFIYVLGQVYRDGLSSADRMAAVTARLNANGSTQWLNTWNVGASNVKANSIAVGSQGNLLVAAEAEVQSDFGMLLTAFLPTGNVDWTFGTNLSDVGSASLSDYAGGFAVSGTFGGPAILGINANGSPAWFVTRSPLAISPPVVSSYSGRLYLQLTNDYQPVEWSERQLDEIDYAMNPLPVEVTIEPAPNGSFNPAAWQSIALPANTVGNAVEGDRIVVMSNPLDRSLALPKP